MKKYFVLWSGGLDSTYLIEKLLKDGNQVTCGYIELLNNKVQSIRELEAMRKMAAIFSKNHGTRFDFKDVISRFELVQFSDNMHLQQPMVWINVLKSVPQSVDEVAIGYVMNDCAISFLEDFHVIFRAYSGMLYKPMTVTFPLIKMNKNTIWHALSYEYREHVTWCEDPDYPKCGRCASCKRMIDAHILREDETHFGKKHPNDGKEDSWKPESLTVNYELDFSEKIVDIHLIKREAA